MNRPRGPAVPLWLDRANERVHRGEEPLRLTPKAFAVLRHLMERPGQLATKGELITSVWPDTAVTEASLSTCIREIRRALDDHPAAPRYIETVHRRGYRYLGATRTVASRSSDALLVGRDPELDALDRVLARVERGERCLVFLAGEAGIGKTALVERFVARTAARTTTQLAQGQCVEHYGACEPYLPWFDMLNYLSRSYGRERLAAVLRRYAPMWLAQLPWLIDADERRQLQREIAGATRERMVRELAEALEALSAESPMVVVLEDLHWSDPSSIDVLAYLARRPQPGRLLLLGTYRPAEMHAASHPLVTLKHELLLRRACEEVPLEFLTTDAVRAYVRSRLPGAPDDLAVQVHRRTDGNPLFMVNVVDYLLVRGTETAHIEVPQSVKELIARQLDRLSRDERRVLDAASVTGAAFSAASVAAALEESTESAEERLAELARRGAFVRAAARSNWPDGTESDGYAFIHALYQNVLYERVGTARRCCMHRRTGERLESGYGDRAEEIAAELALHFQRGRDLQRAVRYLACAGETAIRRGAYIEAIAVLQQGIDLLPALPREVDRAACELHLRVPLGICYMNTRGYAAQEVGDTFQRAHELCRHVRETPHLFRVLRGLWIFALQRTEFRKARALAEELLRVAVSEQDPSLLVEAHRLVGTTLFHLGDFSSACDHLQRGIAQYDAGHHASGAFLYGQDPGVCCHAWHGWTLWYLGYPDRAVESARRSIELARQIGQPFSLSYAMNFAARVCACRGDASAAEAYSREGIRYAREQGLTPMLAMGQVLHGWSRVFLGDDGDAAIGELREGVARWRSTGARLATPYWMYLLASALERAGNSADALHVLNAALALLERTNERWFECELYVLKASLTARRSHRQRHLRRAFHAATERESPSLRLRSANALSLLLRDQGQTDEAKHLVGSAYATFNEGFQTADLAEARALLAQP